MELDQYFWEQQYKNKRTGWDIGYASPPIVEYVDQLKDKTLKILIPGAGNAWEVEYLWKQGFKNVYLLDFSKTAIQQFKDRVPDFPPQHILEKDFFKYSGQYDLILEQTFFSGVLPSQREAYVNKMYELLSEQGKLVGVVFNHEFSFDGPPFGANTQTYLNLFAPNFEILTFELAYNSIKPRKGREHFFIAKRKII